MLGSRRVRSHESSLTNLDAYNPNSPVRIQQYIDPHQFKTQKCQIQHQINQKKFCPFFHDETDRRRDLKSHSYKCQLCPQADNCPQGDECQFAHNKVEQVYHPNRYKTKYCTHIKDCDYGVYCSFAHNDQELIIPIKLDGMVQDKNFWMYQYKTVWCPLTTNHDRASCVYAHNAQDFRRDPKKLQPKECPHWNKTNQILNYDKGGCPDQEECQYCHGWKEFEYHPLIYKTKPCTQTNCNKKLAECAFYHSDQEKRVRKQLADNQWIIEEPNIHVEAKRQPYKPTSNYLGPIIPNYIPQDYMSKEKMEIGQPFCQQSITNTKTSDSHSRRGSDFSDGSKMQKKKHNIQQQFQPQKKHRTAPTTPDQKQLHIMGNNYTIKAQQNVQSNSYLSYSKKLYEEILKLNEGECIYKILQGLKIPEYKLMQMGDQEIKQLKLNEQQIIQLTSALAAIKIEKKYDEHCGDELLSLISNQGKF
ncbi:unnamed protein product (macronuclear) [Paramecium tetraurelia]|uniref:C3H1-type domain-containing protein n=1 Tax=Paramecium tetraurelia TaxID=5888 RepID=A0BG61_PARTE|nr:uncharacterized protein GSPATT00028563001 [Paramecium tetraurelia]CAK57528.1 unnamed protein product [Paramecium tetraurelia]|eukprot:XP_001424926.1 hypothetical protein (macronuclear) [Paramecium tetraurelia strain d4-2]